MKDKSIGPDGVLCYAVLYYRITGQPLITLRFIGSTSTYFDEIIVMSDICLFWINKTWIISASLDKFPIFLLKVNNLAHNLIHACWLFVFLL